MGRSVCWGTRVKSKSNRKFFNEDEKKMIIRMRKEGYTYGDIAARLENEHTPNGVRNICKQLIK